EALADLQAAEALVRTSLPDDSVMLAQIVHQTAILYRQTDQHALADVQLRRAIDLKQKALGPEHPDLAASLNTYANSLSDQGKLDEAMPIFRRALGILEKALGPDHPNVARTLGNMGIAEFNGFRYDEALEHLRRALGLLERQGDVAGAAGFLSATG